MWKQQAIDVAKKSVWKTLIKVTLLHLVSIIFTFNVWLTKLLMPTQPAWLNDITPIRISAPTNVQHIAHVG